MQTAHAIAAAAELGQTQEFVAWVTSNPCAQRWSGIGMKLGRC
jgi:hypothetical protein